MGFSEWADAFLEKVDVPIRERIEKRLKRLEDNPFPADAKFIGRDDGEKVFRYRIGEYRALYKVRNAEKVVLVFFIENRSGVYD